MVERALMPEKRLGFVLLTNVTSSPISLTAMETIWTNLAGEPAAQPANLAGDMQRVKPGNPEATTAATNDSAAAETLCALVGCYVTKDGNRNPEIVERDGKIALVVQGQRPYPLVPREPDVFGTAGLPDTFSVKVDRDGAGKITGITLRQPNGNSPLTRVAEFKSPLTVEELMSKVVEAIGGEQALRRHTSLRRRPSPAT
ncbi:MAG: hypothetical protein MSG64_19670 [Pyrinomonadaceae bacterium MAG19_C2-C3]|nr:hypothetical protein [Pyrinomonadaceae bacterium MAG19_C2-C3]